MDNGENVLTNNLNVISNTISETNNNTTVYDVAKNINTMLSVLTFTIIIIFLFKYLKSTFGFRKG